MLNVTSDNTLYFLQGHYRFPDKMNCSQLNKLQLLLAAKTVEVLASPVRFSYRTWFLLRVSVIVRSLLEGDLVLIHPKLAGGAGVWHMSNVATL